MKRCLVLMLGLFFLSACYEPAAKPKDPIEKDKMVEILAEIYMYQQNSYLLKTGDEGINFSEKDAEIIQRHGITIEKFKENYRYYVLYPEKYNELLQEIKAHLENLIPESERNRNLEEAESPEIK
ncbi:MAG: DUF4296 domain-containing protein [Weeksellaceae bacterium]